MPPPVLTLRDARLTFGGEPLFRGAEVAVARGDKTCLVGRNGSGKSTLLKVLAGLIDLDGGERFAQPGVRVAYLSQDPMPEGGTVAAYVAGGLPPALAHETHRVAAILPTLGLDGDRPTADLSGGEGRRAGIARALVGEPDVLLLDEPTNHLDLPTIRWLEQELAAYRGALVVISHDRAFLNAVSRRTWWLERGLVRTGEHGFLRFDAWRDEVLEAEARELDRMDTRLGQEMHWLHRGVTARRSRNMGRLRRLQALRAERRERGRGQGSLSLSADAGGMSGRLVIEAKEASFAYDDGRAIVAGFSTRILRGDRVGLIGPNGAGKTTLLRLLTGELAPAGGTVRLGTGLVPATLDQRRAALDPEATVRRALVGGEGDQVMVRGQPRHVMGYLKDFLFDPRHADMPVRALSGGERSRLLLARILAQPSNLLILDEPTNDLDMDTLDLLQEALDDYEGTLLLVSHDRDFLDRLVTSVIAVEGDGTIAEYVGGYADYAAQRQPAPAAATPRPARAPARDERPKAAARKLSFKDQRELDGLPARIEALTAEMGRLKDLLADAGLFGRDANAFNRGVARLEEASAELIAAEERWLELEELREALAAGAGG